MRFENSPETSSCLKEGSSPVFDIETVGNDSSSLTPGSSMASVAGKKRLPTISCARADVVEAARMAASMASGHEFLNMEGSSIAVTEAAQGGARRQAKSGGPRASFGAAATWSGRAALTGWRIRSARGGSRRAATIVSGAKGGAAALQRLQWSQACDGNSGLGAG